MASPTEVSFRTLCPGKAGEGPSFQEAPHLDWCLKEVLRSQWAAVGEQKWGEAS
jgi:hypothetical protein